MDRERREEILREVNREKWSGENGGSSGSVLYKVMALVYCVIAAVFMYQVYKVDVLPLKYFAVLAGVILIISLLIIPSMYSKNGVRSRKIVSSVLAVVFSCLFFVGASYAGETMYILEEISLKPSKMVSRYYDVVVRTEDEAVGLSDLQGRTVTAYNAMDGQYSEAKTSLMQSVNIEFDYDESAQACIDSLCEGYTDAVFIERSKYDALKGERPELNRDTRVVHSVVMEVEMTDRTSKAKVTREPFNVLLSGNDLESTRSDVNMIVTVNPRTKHILLTSIPRDYYVELATSGEYDKLTHSGIYGMQETVGTVENLLGININYYVKVNFYAVIDFVDAIGGLDVESPKAFSAGSELFEGRIWYDEGINHLNGMETLTFCRERDAFESGDLARNENQQRVLRALLDKGTQSTVILSNYTSILGSVKKNLETNMTPDEMSSLVKMQLKDMASWTVERQAITGELDWGECYSLGDYASVVERNPEEEAKAYDKIYLVMGEK